MNDEFLEIFFEFPQIPIGKMVCRQLAKLTFLGYYILSIILLQWIKQVLFWKKMFDIIKQNILKRYSIEKLSEIYGVSLPNREEIFQKIQNQNNGC